MTRQVTRSAGRSRWSGKRAGIALLVATGFLIPVLLRLPPARATDQPILASYLYHWMPASHLDALAEHGFNTALIKIAIDVVTPERVSDLQAKVEAGDALGICVFPVVNAHNRHVLESGDPARRYRDRAGKVHSQVPCPADTSYWAAWWTSGPQQFLAATGRLGLDLELYGAPGLGHWPASPCTCKPCVLEYTGYTGPNQGLAVEWLERLSEEDLEDLGGWQRQRLAALLTAAFGGSGTRQVVVLDLGRPGLVSRAVALACHRLDLDVLDFSEMTYARGSRVSKTTMTAAYADLDVDVVTVPGLWLLRWAPDSLEDEAAVLGRTWGGYWIFSSASLHWPPEQLEGPYRLKGRQADYWLALKGANRRLSIP